MKKAQPISLTLTEEQKAWVDSKICPGGARTEVIRRIIDSAMRKETVGTKIRKLKPVKKEAK